MTVKDLRDPDFESLKANKQEFYLFGEHLSRSKAPLLHNTLFKLLNLPWSYQIFESSDFKHINAKFDDERLIGSAVTMPNKVTAVNHVDHLDEIGKGCGSINTIYVRPDSKGTLRKIGTNTDTVGISESFLQNYPQETAQYKGQPGLVYGAGGACRSAVFALKYLLGASKIYIINRFADEVAQVEKDMKSNGFEGEIIHVKTPEMAKELESPRLVVLCVPNFQPSTPEEILAKETLQVFMNQKETGVVLEMCYHPVIETTLYHEFKNQNWKVISGVEAMIYQGIAQQVLWTGIPLNQLPVKEVISHVYDTIQEESSTS